MKKRYTEEQIIKATKEYEAGAKMDDICRCLISLWVPFTTGLASTQAWSQ